MKHNRNCHVFWQSFSYVLVILSGVLCYLYSATVVICPKYIQYYGFG